MVTMDAKTIKEFFESVAGDWDQMRATFYNAGVIDALAEHARVTSADTVVDVDCGTGSSPLVSCHTSGDRSR
jgi:ubiquinone/menaquinone biosynthesis C-methylase UbiE